MKTVLCKQYGQEDETITIVPSGFKNVFIEVYEDAYYNLHVRYITSDELEKYDNVN